ncbi:metal ABC transporter solute-binding protein, Zn/Mn family [Sagittula stellata]|nr:zinc ABC transporter substrate-binding protein [Sagittula stellata]
MTFTRRTFLGAAAALPLVPRMGHAAAPLRVTATTGMIADTASNVAGALAEVTALMGPGVDPHGYRQTRSDIVTLTRGDVALRNGLHLEAQLEDLFETLSSRVPVVPVAEAIPETDILYNTVYEGRPDPHVWMVPRLWRHAVEATRDALTDLRPEEADTFAANTEAYLAQLDALQAYATDVLATVPEPARVLVTAHDAFGYFGAEYGFEVMGIQGISTESEAGLQRIAALVDALVTRGIGAVFVESSVSDRNVRALIEGAASRGADVRIGGELFSDAMGQPGTYEGTWIGMIDHNVTTICKALGGTAPDRGMNGKLNAGI